MCSKKRTADYKFHFIEDEAQSGAPCGLQPGEVNDERRQIFSGTINEANSHQS